MIHKTCTLVTSLIIALFVAVALLSCSSQRSVENVDVPRDPETIARGRTLAKGLAACGFCHGESSHPNAMLTGGLPYYDILGEVRAPNITPAKSGIGEWSFIEIAKAIRNSEGRNGRELSSAAHEGYAWLSDRDLFAIVAYLKSLAPVEHEVPRRELSFFDKGKSFIFERRTGDLGFIPTINPRFEKEYGSYLVENVGRCISCHNSPGTVFSGHEYLTGGETVQTAEGAKIAPGITGSEEQGIGTWSVESLVKYLRIGETPGGDVVNPSFCPIKFYANAEEKDLIAIAKYLKSVDAGT